MRLVRFANGVATYLNEPECDLSYKGCMKRARVFYNVHGCASYYACNTCGNMLAAQMLKSFTEHDKLFCKACGKQVSLRGGYITITDIKEEKSRNEKKTTGRKPGESGSTT